MAGRHHVEIGGLSVAPDGKRAVVVACLDNLLKGAATQALQNLNRALGLPDLRASRMNDAAFPCRRGGSRERSRGNRVLATCTVAHVIAPSAPLKHRTERVTPMADLLWQKDGVRVDARIMQFLAGDDVLLDRQFLLHDITASKAHVQGLGRIGVLDDDEVAAIVRELDALAADFRSGDFVLDERHEDGHSAIEARLVERLGDTGRKVHTGRSRNDQVLVATRLWLKERLAELAGLCLAIAGVCLDRAEGESLPMPGYTHLQRAVVSSTAMWFAGFAEGFPGQRASRARDTRAWLDANPLGTAAGYGVNLPLDRDYTTRGAGLRAHAGQPGLRAALARQVRAGRAGRAGQRAAGPAPPGLGPVAVHHRRIRLRRSCRTNTPPAARSCPTSAIPT